MRTWQEISNEKCSAVIALVRGEIVNINRMQQSDLLQNRKQSAIGNRLLTIHPQDQSIWRNKPIFLTTVKRRILAAQLGEQ